MAHELDIRDGKAAIAYVGDVPWHGLGQALTQDASIETWKREAMMDWSIKESTVLYRGNQGHFAKMSEKKVLFRGDTNDALAVVGEDYKVVQPGEVLEFFRDLVALQGFKLSTAGVLFGGRRFWALAETGRELDVLGKDRVKGNLLLITSADGTLSTQASFVSTRVVCNNTLKIALGEDGKRARVTHRSVFDPMKLKDELGLIDDAWEKFKQNVTDLSKTKIDDAKAREFITSLLAKPNLSVEDQPYTVAKDTGAIMARYNDGMGTNMAKGTVWGVLNSITEWADHDSRARSADRKLWGSWFGKDANIKEAAYQKALELI